MLFVNPKSSIAFAPQNGAALMLDAFEAASLIYACMAGP
jgi:hypothetical protein